MTWPVADTARSKEGVRASGSSTQAIEIRETAFLWLRYIVHISHEVCYSIVEACYSVVHISYEVRWFNTGKRNKGDGVSLALLHRPYFPRVLLLCRPYLLWGLLLYRPYFLWGLLSQHSNRNKEDGILFALLQLSLIHISEPTRHA